MHHKHFILGTACLFLATGCVGTAKLESTIRKGYTGKIDKVYVTLLTSSSGSTNFLKALKPALEQKFKIYDIDCVAHYYDNLNLDEKSTIKTEMETLHPNYIMIFSQVSKTTLNGGESGGTFEITLQEPGSDSLIWKATVETATGFWVGVPNSAGSPEVTADTVINRLLQDGLIKQPTQPLPSK